MKDMTADGDDHETEEPDDDATSSDASEHDQESEPKPPAWPLRWQLARESNLRDALGPILRELAGINRIAEAARAATPRIEPQRFDVPKIDIPEILLPSELGRSLID